MANCCLLSTLGLHGSGDICGLRALRTLGPGSFSTRLPRIPEGTPATSSLRACRRRDAQNSYHRRVEPMQRPVDSRPPYFDARFALYRGTSRTSVRTSPLPPPPPPPPPPPLWPSPPARRPGSASACWPLWKREVPRRLLGGRGDRKIEVRRNAAKAPAAPQACGLDESDRSQPACRKILERSPGGDSDQGRGVLAG